jgi:folate-binding Fe-S cluster repair protein YgfZ
MNLRMDRKEIAIGKLKELAALDRKNNNEMTIQEKLEAITFLRGCFYGQEATTGRLQRFYKILKRA